MRALTLARFSIKRLFRHRPVLIALYALPLLAALLRVLFVQSHAMLVCAWACPFVCAVSTGGLLYMQYLVDSASGLNAGIISSPVRQSELVGSRVLTGLIIFACQMVIFALILSVRSY